VLLLAFLTAPFSAEAADDPFIGTWKRVTAKSKSSSGPVTELAFTYEPVPNGLRMILKRPDGTQAGTVEYLFDGMPHQPGTSGTVRQVGAEQRFDKRHGTYRFETTLTRSGKVVMTSRSEVSKDRRTMTTIVKGVETDGTKLSSIWVAERQ
jgi:hypothetical protein